MSQDQSSIKQKTLYDRFRSSDQQIDFLMSDKGESFLDGQIMKMMKDMDAEEIIEFSTQFFKSGLNQCSSLQSLISNELTSRINMEGGSANVPQTFPIRNQMTKKTEKPTQSTNKPSRISDALPQIMKEVALIQQALEGNDQIGAVCEEKEANAQQEADRINFEQYTYEQYKPELGHDSDYLTEDYHDYSLAQATQKQRKNLQKSAQQTTEQQEFHQNQADQHHPQSSYPTTIEQNAQLDFDQIQRIELPQNKFRIRYNNGDSYEGELQNQMKNGWGDYSYSTGQRYVGNFIDDQIHGYGRYYFLSGAQYEGDWSGGLKHGMGILKFSNGDLYEGQFVNDLFNGKGTYTSQNGDLFKGLWKNGMKHGKGTFEGFDGSIQIGSWVNDKFQI